MRPGPGVPGLGSRCVAAARTPGPERRERADPRGAGRRTPPPDAARGPPPTPRPAGAAPARTPGGPRPPPAPAAGPPPPTGPRRPPPGADAGTPLPAAACAARRRGPLRWEPPGLPPAAPPVDGWASPPPPGARLRLRPAPGRAATPVRRPNYPPAGYPPQGYQAVGYPAARQTDSKAVIGLVLAISSWLVCPLITAIIALVLAGQSNRAIDASGGRLEGRSMNTATKVIAWINIVLSVLALIAVVG